MELNLERFVILTVPAEWAKLPRASCVCRLSNTYCAALSGDTMSKLTPLWVVEKH